MNLIRNILIGGYFNPAQETQLRFTIATTIYIACPSDIEKNSFIDLKTFRSEATVYPIRCHYIIQLQSIFVEKSLLFNSNFPIVIYSPYLRGNPMPFQIKAEKIV